MPATITTTSVATAPNTVVPHENAFMTSLPMEEPLTSSDSEANGTVLERLCAGGGQALDEAGELAADPRAEQIARDAQHGDDAEAGGEQRQALAHRRSGPDRPGDGAQHHGNEDRAEDQQQDIGEHIEGGRQGDDGDENQHPADEDGVRYGGAGP